MWTRRHALAARSRTLAPIAALAAGVGVVVASSSGATAPRPVVSAECAPDAQGCGNAPETRRYSTGQFAITCTSTGQVCSPAGKLIFRTPSKLTIESITYTTGPEHCSPVRVLLSLDGERIGHTPWLEPGSSTAIATPDRVIKRGRHALGYQAAGRKGGCNGGALMGWGGEIVLTGTLPCPTPRHKVDMRVAPRSSGRGRDSIRAAAPKVCDLDVQVDPLDRPKSGVSLGGGQLAGAGPGFIDKDRLDAASTVHPGNGGVFAGTCLSGCTNLLVVVRDVNRDAVKNATVTVSAQPVKGQNVVTPPGGGGFVCTARAINEQQTEPVCGHEVTRRTDSEYGDAYFRLWLPGVTDTDPSRSPVPMRLHVTAKGSTECGCEDATGTANLSILIAPHIIYKRPRVVLSHNEALALTHWAKNGQFGDYAKTLEKFLRVEQGKRVPGLADALNFLGAYADLTVLEWFAGRYELADSGLLELDKQDLVNYALKVLLDTWGKYLDVPAKLDSIITRGLKGRDLQRFKRELKVLEGSPDTGLRKRAREILRLLEEGALRGKRLDQVVKEAHKLKSQVEQAIKVGVEGVAKPLKDYLTTDNSIRGFILKMLRRYGHWLNGHKAERYVTTLKMYEVSYCTPGSGIFGAFGTNCSTDVPVGTDYRIYPAFSQRNPPIDFYAAPPDALEYSAPDWIREQCVVKKNCSDP